MADPKMKAKANGTQTTGTTGIYKLANCARQVQKSGNKATQVHPRYPSVIQDYPPSLKLKDIIFNVINNV